MIKYVDEEVSFRLTAKSNKNSAMSTEGDMFAQELLGAEGESTQEPAGSSEDEYSSIFSPLRSQSQSLFAGLTTH